MTNKVPTEVPTVKEVLENSLNLVESFNNIGIPVSLYSKPPSGIGTFVISRGPGFPGQIFLWPGTEATLEIIPDFSKRQALVTVDEPEREIKRTVSVNSRALDSETIKRLARSNFGINVPTGTKFSFDIKKALASKKEHRGYGGLVIYELKVPVVAKIQAALQQFLVGFDESSLFVSLMPGVFSSVDEAHLALVPKSCLTRTGELRRGVVRQGEWFFKPVPLAKSLELEKIYNRRVKRSSNLHLVNRSLEFGSSHRAERFLPSSSSDKTNYVSGKISDTRTMRHETVDLGSQWHELMRNNERIPEPNLRVRSRRWD